MIARSFILLALCCAQFARPQMRQTKLPDSLRGKSFDYIFEKIKDSATLKSTRDIYLKAFIIKASNECNYEELAQGYKNYVHYAPENLRLAYADSMVNAAKYTRDNAAIGSAYLSKGVAYYGAKQLTIALDSYLIANNYIIKTDDRYLIYKAKYNIAQIKHLLGYYDEAITLFRECISFLKKEDDRGYLNALHSLGLCYNKAGNFGLCSAINKKGIKECKALAQPKMLPYFELSDGVNHCDMHNYGLAIKKIAASINAIPENDFGNRAVGYFHLGKSYWMLGNKEEAITYFKEVHKVFARKNYIRPDLRETYELLITYYKEKDDVRSQLYYIETLLKVDKQLYTTFYYLQGKIAKEYDTKELQVDKARIERSLERKKYNEIIFISVILLLLVLAIILIVRHIMARRVFRQKYEVLLQKLEASRHQKMKEDDNLDINGDTVSKILRQLEKFELGKKYLERDLTMTKLAALFTTNTTYLSKVISHHKGKNFPDYINDLKIDYIAKRIKDEKVLRKYKNDALAEEAGFSSTPRFANAFYARTGITTRFFIEELIKDERETDESGEIPA